MHTELDVTKVARGTMVDMNLDAHGSEFDLTAAVVKLLKSPA